MAISSLGVRSPCYIYIASHIFPPNLLQGRRKVSKILGVGRVVINIVGIICPLIELGLTDLPESGGRVLPPWFQRLCAKMHHRSNLIGTKDRWISLENLILIEISFALFSKDYSTVLKIHKGLFFGTY